MLASRFSAGLSATHRAPFTAATRRNATAVTVTRPLDAHNAPGSSRPRIFTCHAAETDAAVDQSTAPELTLSPPAQRLQGLLDNKQTRDVRSKANGLAATRKLVRVNMGKKGITDNFVIDCMRALRGHEVIRVSVTEGADTDMEDAAEILSGLLDCVCVYKIGSSLTLYRSRDLPMPSNITDVAAERAGAKLQKQQAPRRPQQKQRSRR